MTHRRDAMDPWREPLRKTVTGYVWLFENGGNHLSRITPPEEEAHRLHGKVIACKRFTVEIEEGCFDE